MQALISMAGLTAVFAGFVVFSMKEIAEWEKFFTVHEDQQLPVRMERQLSLERVSGAHRQH